MIRAFPEILQWKFTAKEKKSDGCLFLMKKLLLYQLKTKFDSSKRNEEVYEGLSIKTVEDPEDEEALKLEEPNYALVALHEGNLGQISTQSQQNMSHITIIMTKINRM